MHVLVYFPSGINTINVFKSYFKARSLQRIPKNMTNLKSMFQAQTLINVILLL